ncbi:MAG: glycosyltransferase family 39 protein [Chloroflexia bacterium]
MTAALTHLLRDRGLLVLLALMLLGLPLITTRIYASDEIKYFAYLHSLSFDRDLDFTNDYQHWVDQALQGKKPDIQRAALLKTLLKPNPATGLPINEAPIGTAILWAPAFALAHLGVLAARALGAKVAADGYSQPYIAAVCYASYLYGWAGLLLIYGLLRRFWDQFAAALATLTVWLGTSAFFYMVIAPPWSHSASLFTVSLFTTVWLRTRRPAGRSLREWALLGFCAGLMMLVREQDALFLALPAVESVLRLLQGKGGPRAEPRLTEGKGSAVRWASGWALMLLTAAITFIPQLVVYEVLGGRLGPSSTVGEKLNWLSPHALSVLLDPQYGLLPWAPVVLPALVGLGLLWRRDRGLATALLVAFIAQVWIAGAFSTWQGKSSFGQRRFVNCTVLFALGLGSVIGWARERGVSRALIALLGVLFVAWEGGLAVQYSALWNSARRQAGLEWPGVIADQLGLPGQLPGIVRRFLFDRKSFFSGESGR